jgi:hypothetical protein
MLLQGRQVRALANRGDFCCQGGAYILLEALEMGCPTGARVHSAPPQVEAVSVEQPEAVTPALEPAVVQLDGDISPGLSQPGCSRQRGCGPPGWEERPSGNE